MADNKISGGTLLQIAQLGVPLLRDKSPEVKEITKSEIRKLINDLIATVVEVDGVGIAAPQVYKSLRIFIIASHPSPRYPKAPRMKPIALINPVVISGSEETEKDWEGCLSIPGIRGLVPRSTELTVKYFTPAGKEVKKTFTGFLARIFQHEYDHLEGKVFIDRLETTKDVITEKEFRRMFGRRKRK